MATKVLTLRLESDVFRAICAFQQQHEMENPSEAIRVLLDIAMRDTVALDAAYRRAAWRAGIRRGAFRLREKLDEAVADALGITPEDLAAEK